MPHRVGWWGRSVPHVVLRRSVPHVVLGRSMPHVVLGRSVSHIVGWWGRSVPHSIWVVGWLSVARGRGDCDAIATMVHPLGKARGCEG